ncbi:Protein CBG23016 [Caenorhabditis briggsae]|uniref:U3 small nucleolar ribonucleoprotein protein MPP10 n=1 Tax=Caenorhabditis briggsae TaxID=6238 RepID=A8Y3F8_CAEBR|nr:Protein CBG23016 [Caenorhabditis briggsae]CAP39427.2 Protein CBG23016 [Caenorhabditis briggsae]
MAKSKSKNDDVQELVLPEIGNFSQFFKSRSKFSECMTDVISNVYEWSTSLDPSAEADLPLPFVSKNPEVVWSYLKHQNKQLDGLNRKYKGFLSELIGKPHIRLSAKQQESEDSEDVDSEDIDDEEEEDLEDEEGLEDVDDEEEGDMDLFNLTESDLKTLDADLKKMAEEEDSGEDSEGVTPSSEAAPKKFKKSIVDDEFFSLEEMHDYLKKTERGGGKKTSEEEMMFEDEDSWDGKTDYTYEDFFGARDAAPESSPAKKKGVEKKRKAGEADLSSVDDGKNAKKRVRFAMDEQESEEEEEEEDPEDVDDEEAEMDDEEEEEGGPVLLGADLEEKKESSGFERRQEKMKERIQKLEEENLAPKTWELSGEVAADQRDQNTLLEKHVDFDHGAKRAPEVTEEFTDRLESLIKQRIKDKAWDDVVRVKKVEAKGARFETEAIENVMNQKTSLAEVYEKEYQNAMGNGGGGEKKENPAHEAIKGKMGELFRLIDALTHFEYKPDQAREEVKVVSNMAALRVEEVGITASTEAQLMAPEEIAKKMRSIEKGKEERTATDRARERRAKKAKQRSMVEKFGEEKVFGEAKEKKREKAERGKDKGAGDKIKSSNFFAKLQETVQNEKAGNAVTKKKKVVKRVKTDKNSAAIKL